MATFPGFNDDQIKEIKEQAKRFWDEATNEHDQFFENTNDRQRMAHALLPQKIADAYKKRPDLSQLAPADFFVNLASLRAAVHNLVFGSKPYGNLSIFGSPDFLDPRIQKAELVLQQMNDVARDDDVTGKCVHQALYAGMSCCFTKWTRMNQRDVLRDPKDKKWLLDENKRPIFQNKEMAAFAEVVPIDIRRVRIDPSAEKISDRRIVAHHAIRQLSELLALHENPNHFYNFDKAELEKSSFNQEEYYKYVVGEKDALGLNKEPNKDFGDKVVEVRFHRGIFRVKRQGEISFEDLVVDIANEEIVLGIKANDLPISGVEMYDFPVIDDEFGRLFPMGVIEPAEDMWIYLFMILNNILDRNNRDTYEMYLGDAAAMQGQDEYISYEGGKIIKVDTVGAGLPTVNAALQPLARPAPPANSMALAAIISDMIQKIMKLSDYIQGYNPSRQETATAATLLVQGGRSLLMHIVDKLKLSFWQPVWQKKLILFNFFMGDQQSVIAGKDGEIEIQPGEINLLWQVDIDTKANKDRPDIIRRTVEMYPSLYNAKGIDQTELTRTMIQSLEFPNQSKILINSEHIQVTVDRENMAMAGGVQQPVHPDDNHQMHYQGHEEFLENPDLNDAQVNAIAEHGQIHLEEIEKENVGALGNTKELGGASGLGSTVNPESAAATKRTGTGEGLKAGSRV